MREIKGNLFDRELGAVLVITTNGVVKTDGEAVMGAGVALEAKKRWPDLPARLGDCITRLGNKVFRFPYLKNTIITFPVKNHFKQKADLDLIEESCKKLAEISTQYMLRDQSIYLPKPGCGAGKLDWETQVKPICEKYFDDRFVIVDLR